MGFAVLGMVMNVFQIYGVQYFIRELGLTIPQAGLRIGAAIAVCGTIGVLVGGWLTDRWHAAGAVDAAMRVGRTAAIALIPFATGCTLFGDLDWSTLFLLPIGFFTAFSFGAGAAGVVVLTPPATRAQASAIYMLCLNLVGIGLAPWLTAAITQYGFQDDLAVGKSLRDRRRWCGGARRAALHVGSTAHAQGTLAHMRPNAPLRILALAFVCFGLAVTAPHAQARQWLPKVDARAVRLAPIRPTDVPSDAELQKSGAVIGEIKIRANPIFDTTRPEEDAELFRLANKLHIRTKQDTIATQLLFAPGDRYDPRLLEETARLLRDTRYLQEAYITPVAISATDGSTSKSSPTTCGL
jgi:hypothetical protein